MLFHSLIYESLQQIVWRNFEVIEKDNTAYVSMNAGVSVLNGEIKMHMTWRSQITTNDP